MGGTIGEGGTTTRTPLSPIPNMASTKPAGTGSAAGSTKGEAKKAASDTAAQAKSAAKDVASTAKSAAKDVASTATDAAKDLAGQAADKAEATVKDHKSTAADALHDVADALHQTGDSLIQDDHDAFGQYAQQAAHQIDQFQSAIRDKSVGQLLDEAERFARREPGLFVGGAFLLGIAGARFLKASASEADGGRPAGSGYGTGSRYAAGSTYGGSTYGSARTTSSGSMGTGSMGTGTMGTGSMGYGYRQRLDGHRRDPLGRDRRDRDGPRRRHRVAGLAPRHVGDPVDGRARRDDRRRRHPLALWQTTDPPSRPARPTS